MVSYADFHAMPARRKAAMEQGLRTYLAVPEGVRIYLDNGSFSFHRKGHDVPVEDYEAFVRAARPDWYPPPQDFIPVPSMSLDEQRECRRRTMEMNIRFNYDGFVPVVHVGGHLEDYVAELNRDELLRRKRAVALGGIVPNLLRSPKAMPYERVLRILRHVRLAFEEKRVHVFGMGGTATLHLGALLGVDSLDSAGWRNRAARGIVQMPGRGDRVVSNLGKWRGRAPSDEEWELLTTCECPACQLRGVDGLRETGLIGFSNRAVHNLSTLLKEAAGIERNLAAGTYEAWYASHVDNSIYRPLIDRALELRTQID
jgi:tRNA-guanine family transglycosylase